MKALAWRAARITACVLVCGWTGCATPDETTEGELVLGTGETSFEPLQAGQEVPLVAGSQGGYHFWLSLEVEGLEGPRMRMQLQLSPEGELEPSESDVRIGVARLDDRPGWSDYIGWPARVFEPWCAVGRPMQVDVRLEDLEGRVARAHTEVVPVAPAGGFAQSCEETP